MERVRPGPFPWYRGWTMVGLGIVMVMMSVGSVLYGYSIYVTPVSEELGLSRETINSGIVFQHLGTALLTPMIGRMLDKVKVSTIVAISGICMGGGLMALSIGDALWPKAALLFFPISFGFSGAGSIASYVLVSRWFKVNRGRAMAIVAFGQSGGSVVFAPVVAQLVAAFGWREALVYQGAFVGIALLLIAWGMVDRPVEGETEPKPKSLDESEPVPQVPDEPPLPLKQIIANPTFWVLAGIVALTLAVVQATVVSLVPLANGRGIDLVQASTLISMIGVSGLLGKFALAIIADRFDRMKLVTFGVAVIMAFAFSLTLELGYWGLAISCSLAGLAIAGFWPVYSALLADIFGANSLGSVEGLVAPIISLTSAGAIYLAGVTFDVNGDYRLTFLIFGAALGVALLLSLSLQFMQYRRARTAKS
ncbi:MFS transporter [Erythrobacter litoralis]|nr:MFS transporter [Erythrobacter litoralis]